MHEVHFIRDHFVRRSNCTQVIFYGPLLQFAVYSIISIFTFAASLTIKNIIVINDFYLSNKPIDNDKFVQKNIIVKMIFIYLISSLRMMNLFLTEIEQITLMVRSNGNLKFLNNERKNKCSDGSMAVQLLALLGNYARQTDRPTDQQMDRMGHREVTLPVIHNTQLNCGGA